MPRGNSGISYPKVWLSSLKMSSEKHAKMTLSLFTERDCAETIDVLAESFCRNDPIEAALSITPDEFQTMIRLELDAVPREDLSMVMRDDGTGRIVAVAIATDAMADPVDSGAKASAKFAPIAEIARTCHDRYFAARTILPGSHLYIFAIGVLPASSGRGLGRSIVGAMLEHARTKGYRAAFTLATNVVSARIFQGFGFEPIYSIRYQDYRHNGMAVFASIKDSPSIDLMECPDLGAIDFTRNR